MVKKIFSATVIGLKCQTVDVEADVSNGIPVFNIVGLGGSSIQESKDRVRASIKNSQLEFPLMRKTINLAPAEIKKHGSHFDLPIALSLLLATDQIKPYYLADSLIVGELSLDGRLKPINGALIIVEHAQKQGFKRVFFPSENYFEAKFITGIDLFPIKSLQEIVELLNEKHKLKPSPPELLTSLKIDQKSQHDWPIIFGQEKAQRALLISAAGRHNTLYCGMPGTGKTMLARQIVNLLPPMSPAEILESTKIYSVSGRLNKKEIVMERPFREINNNTTITAMLGGGLNPKPGEITLAHNGVLFLDEVTEFSKATLEALRQPIEDKNIVINRSAMTCLYPAKFLFLATMNPCPCGFHGEKNTRCNCTPLQIKNYQRRLSGPIKDRIDIFVKTEAKINHAQILQKQQNPLFNHLHQIQIAYKKQELRFKNSQTKFNGDMLTDEIQLYCQLHVNLKQILDQAAERMGFSYRTYLRTLKVARTIADISDHDEIAEEDLLEALQYRQNIIFS